MPSIWPAMFCRKIDLNKSDAQKLRSSGGRSMENAKKICTLSSGMLFFRWSLFCKRVDHATTAPQNLVPARASIVAMVLMLLVFIGFSTYQNLNRARTHALRFVHREGVALMQAIEAGARAWMMTPMWQGDSVERRGNRPKRRHRLHLSGRSRRTGDSSFRRLDRLGDSKNMPKRTGGSFTDSPLGQRIFSCGIPGRETSGSLKMRWSGP